MTYYIKKLIWSPNKITDSAYGSTFFISTGSHGLHVIIGKTFLITCLLRQTTLHLSYVLASVSKQQPDADILVDVVGLFL